MATVIGATGPIHRGLWDSIGSDKPEIVALPYLSKHRAIIDRWLQIGLYRISDYHYSAECE